MAFRHEKRLMCATDHKRPKMARERRRARRAPRARRRRGERRAAICAKSNGTAALIYCVI